MEEREMVDRAGTLLVKLQPYAALHRQLSTARDLVAMQGHRAVGPHRAACNVRRLAALMERARALVDGVR